MRASQTLKILFCLMAVLLIAKPLAAFNMYKRVAASKTPSNQFLLLRLVKKRKEGEYADEMIAEVVSAQQNIALPIFKVLLRYASFIALLCSLRIDAVTSILKQAIKNTFFKVMAASAYFLLIGKLSI